jgi:hypothetical protein
MPTAVLSKPTLCSPCTGITFEALWNQEGYTHLDDIWFLEESARSCSICNLLQLLI